MWLTKPTSRPVRIVWQVAACFAPFLWAVYQFHAAQDSRIYFPVIAPLRTERGRETAVSFRSDDRRAEKYDIQIIADSPQPRTDNGISETVLPIEYDVRCNGAKVPLIDHAIWKSWANFGDKQVIVFTANSFKASPNRVYTVTVRPKEDLKSFRLSHPRLRIFSFGQWYGRAMSSQIISLMGALVFFLIGTAFFVTRLRKKRIVAFSALAAVIGIVSPVAVQSLATPPAISAMAQAVSTQINQYRASRGLPLLTLDARISGQARAHSQNMANGRVAFSHDGFDQRIKAISLVIPCSGAAENVSYSQGYRDPATVAVKGWLKSPGHLKNIEGNYSAKGLTGIGVAKNAKGEVYFTQIFIRPR